MNTMRNLKVAILGSRGIPAKYGGFESFVENLSERLSKMGVDVTVFCPSYNSYKKHLYKGVKLRFALNLEKYLGGAGTLLFDLLSLLKASLLDFSIVYMLGYSSSIFCIIPKIFRKKVIINTDGLEWKRSKWSKFARAYLKFSEWFATKVADVLVSDSLAIKDYYKKRYGKNSVFIPNGSEIYFPRRPETLKEFGLEKFDYYLVVARLEPENNIHTIIKGFSLSNSKKKLFIVTNIKKTKYFKEIMELCKRDERIIFFGPLYERDKLNEIRANAFAYIHGHSVGGTNPSLLESMGCGSVVIAYDVPFNREVLRNKGMFFKNESELKAIIEQLEKLDKMMVRKIGEKNREIIKKCYNWEIISKKYFRLFQRVIK